MQLVPRPKYVEIVCDQFFKILNGLSVKSAWQNVKL